MIYSVNIEAAQNGFMVCAMIKETSKDEDYTDYKTTKSVFTDWNSVIEYVKTLKVEAS